MNSVRRARGDAPESDAGASLVLVLVLLVFTGLVVASVMRLNNTSLDAALVAQGQVQTIRDGDGALAAAVNKVRNSTYNNDTGQSCDPLNLSGPNSTQALAVTCQGAPGTGALGQVAFGAGNRPPAGLMTLGNTSETGIHETGSSSSSSLRVDGGAQSNSTITASPGSLVVTSGQATARGVCSGTITSTPAPACNVGVAVADPAVATPSDYVQPSAGMTYRPVPTCPATAGATVKFSPGYYDDAVGLTSLMSTCTGRTFWFQPASGGGVGVYYFDFHNGESPAFQGSTVWSIANSAVRVVAGTPPTSGPGQWNPDAATRQVPPIPGACVSPTGSATNNGVEFVFGGRSQLSITAGQLELCGQYYADKPPIAIYGAKTGANPAETNAYGLTLTSAADGGCDRTFTNPMYIRYLDGNPSGHSPALTAAKPTACVDTSGYAPAPAIPAGAILTNATLVVSHVESVIPATLTATLTPTRAGASALPATAITPYVHSGSATHTEGYEITSDLFDEVHANGFTGASIRYFVARGASNTTARVDTIQLNLSWKAPALRAQNTAIDGYSATGSRSITATVAASASTTAPVTYTATGSPVAATNCVGATPYPGAGACAAVTVAGSQSGLYVAGTGYAPLSGFDLSQSNVSSPVFSVGLVARKLEANLSAASGYAGPVIMIPPDSAGAQPLKVYFLQYLCPVGASCTPPTTGWQLSLPWVLAGSGSATYTDPTGVPVSGSRNVSVKSWDLGQ